MTRPLAGLSEPWRACLELAWAAYRAGSLPIGAVAVDDGGAVIARGRNRIAETTETSPHVSGTPYLAGTRLAHAEVNALLELGERARTERVSIFTSTEPCPLCMGAARIAGIAQVRYASRDAWAGCAVMSEVVPYLARRGPAADGPEPALEEPLLAWQVAAHLRGATREPPFLPTWRAQHPRVCALGEALAAEDTLGDLARLGADLAEVWSLLTRRLTRGDPPRW